jgi:hypothetical protein
MTWTGQVTPVTELRNAYKFYSEKLKVGDQVEDLVVDGRIILTLKKKSVNVWTGVFCFSIKTNGGLLCTR